VIHVSLQPAHYPDYSSITSIRNSGFTFLQSETLQEAQDIALTAHALAIKSGKGVIHFFDAGSSAQDNHIPFENLEVVKAILNLDAVKTFQSRKIGGTSIYADDGRIATIPETSTPIQALPGAMDGVESTPVLSSEPLTPSKASSVGSSKSGRESSVDSKASVSSATTVESSGVRPVTSDDIYNFVTAIWYQFKEGLGREYTPFQYSGPANAEDALFIFGSDVGTFAQAIDAAKSSDIYAKSGVITARLYRPWLGSKLIEAIPKSIRRIAVLEQIRRKTTKWGPLLLDLLTTLKSGPGGGVETIVGHQLGYIAPETVRQAYPES
jgi:sulfite reductase (NADPH) hemoprotein beta-component